MNTADTSQNTNQQPPADTSQIGSAPVTATAQPAADGITPNPTIANSPDNGGTSDGGAGVVTTPGYGISHRPKLDLAAYQKMLTVVPVAPQATAPPVAPAPTPTAQPAPVVPTPTPQAQITQPPAAVAPPAAPVAPAPVDHEPGKLRFRPTGDDANVQASVIQIAKDSGGSILDPNIINRARAIYGLPAIGVAPAAPVAPTAPTPAPAPIPVAAPVTPAPVAVTAPVNVPVDTTALDAEIATLRTQLIEAKDNFQTAKEVELEEKLADARAKKNHMLSTAAQQAAQKAADAAAQQAQAQFHAWNEQTAKAVAKFPDAANAHSALSIRAAEMQAAAKLNNDPMAESIYSGKVFIELAAEELGIAPATAAPVSPVVTTPAPPSVRPPASSLIAGGTGQQTTRPTTDSSQPAKFTRETYDEMMNRARGTNYAVPRP